MDLQKKQKQLGQRGRHVASTNTFPMPSLLDFHLLHGVSSVAPSTQELEQQRIIIMHRTQSRMRVSIFARAPHTQELEQQLKGRETQLVDLQKTAVRGVCAPGCS